MNGVRMFLQKCFLIFNTLYDYYKRYRTSQYSPTLYRIADIKLREETCYLMVQIKGKSSYIECNPEDILADDAYLEGFSKKDIRTITYFAYAHFNRPQYHLVMQEFCDQLKRMRFQLKALHHNEIVTKTAAEISCDKKLIRKLSQEDVQCISYIAGLEQYHLEKIG